MRKPIHFRLIEKGNGLLYAIRGLDTWKENKLGTL